MAYNNDTPIGAIIPFAGYYFPVAKPFLQMQQDNPELNEEMYRTGIDNANALAENGWLLCDGKEYSLTINPVDPLYELCKILSLAWGGNVYPTGNTFRVPDLRGLFLRGVTSASIQDPDVSSRTKLYPGDLYGQTGNQVGSFQMDEVIKHHHSYKWRKGGGQDYRGANYGSGTEDTSAYGGNETRPKNAYVHYLMKAAHQSLNLQQLEEYSHN